MLVSFSEKIFYACPHIFDEGQHIFVVAHASHVHHMGAEMLWLRVVIDVSETSRVNYVSYVDSGQLSESLPSLRNAWFVPPVGLGYVQASAAGRDLVDAISEIFAS